MSSFARRAGRKTRDVTRTSALGAALAGVLLASTLVGAPAVAQEAPSADGPETSPIEPVRVEFSRSTVNRVAHYSRRSPAGVYDVYEFGPAASNSLWPAHHDVVYRVDVGDELPGDEAFAWLGEAGETGWVTGNGTHYTIEADNRRVLFDLRGNAGVDPDDPRMELRVAGVDAPDGGVYSLYETPTVQMLNADEGLDPDQPVGPVRTGTGTQRDGSPQQAPDGGWVDLFDTVTRTDPARLPTSTSTTHRFTAEGLYCVTYDLRFPGAGGHQAELSTLVRFAVGDEIDAGAECGAAPGDGSPTVPVVAGDPPSLEEGDDGVVYHRSSHLDGVFPVLHGLADGEPSLELASLSGSLRSDHRVLSYDELVIVLDDRALNTVPDDDAWRSFADPGSTFWLNDHGGAYQSYWPWVGLSTEHPSINGVLDRDTTDIQIRLDAVTGQDGRPAPGTFASWNDQPSDHRWWNPSAELPVSHRFNTGIHAHQNWGFTEPGVYCLTFTAEVGLPDGSRVSDRGQLTWVIGNQDYRQVRPCSTTQDTPGIPAKNLAPADEPTVEVVDTPAALATSVQDGRLLVGLHQDDPTALGQGVTRSIDDTVIVPRTNVVDGQYRAWDLTWDQTRVHPDDVEGDVTWRILDVDGPGELLTAGAGRLQADLAFDLPEGLDATTLWPGAASGGTRWTFTAPGVYCVGMEWGATPAGADRPSAERHVATIVVDPDGELEVAETCAGTTVGDDARPVVPAAAALSLTAGQAVAGGEATVIGSGFLTGEQVELSLAGGASTSASTDTGGGFEAALRVPEDLDPGAYDIVAIGTTSGRTATVRLTVVDDDPGAVSQRIVATLDGTAGALVISVDPEDRTVTLPDFRLAADGASWETAGELRPVTVADTRPGAPGWIASGQVGDFSAEAASFVGSFLGWAPKVLSQADGQGVDAGGVVAPGFPSGDGLSSARPLASATAGSGTGTAQLGADLELRVPSATRPGVYQATLTFTAI